MKTAIFPGSFDPFTVGHFSIVERGLKLFDSVVIAIGINESKNNMYSSVQRLQMIGKLYANEPRVKVVEYSGLTVDAAKEYNAEFILRGVRSYKDFEYEQNIAEVNRQISGIETVVLFSLPQYAHISSSVVRELMHFNRDITPFIPKNLLNI